MAVTGFSSITWGKEPISADKLQQMAANDQWLYENTPRMFYTRNGAVRQNGIKMACGVATVASTTSNQNHKDVFFGSYFTGGCKPVVTTGYSAVPIGRLHIEIRGLDDTTNIDSSGFRIWAYANFLGATTTSKNNALTANIYVHWIAMGY